MASQYFSKEEASEFITTKLGVNLNTEDKHELLCSITSSYMRKIPFQNLTLMATPIEQRAIPTMEECKKSVVEGYGGTCFALNSVMYFLLKALGFDVHMLLCSVSLPTTKDHAAVLVRSLKSEGDKWLVDVGFGHPSFEPINLDFEKEGEIITQSYMTYKYEKRGDTYLRLHLYDKSVTFPTVEDGWAHAYYFTLEPFDYKVISESIDKAVYKYEEPPHFFHDSPRIILFDSNMKAICLKDDFFLKEGDDCRFKRENIEGDVVEAIHQQFPSLPVKIIQSAMTSFKDLQK